jgi:hypothetical protein
VNWTLLFGGAVAYSCEERQEPHSDGQPESILVREPLGYLPPKKAISAFDLIDLYIQLLLHFLADCSVAESAGLSSPLSPASSGISSLSRRVFSGYRERFGFGTGIYAVCVVFWLHPEINHVL